MTATDLPDLIDRLGQSAMDCRAVITEAHQATRDLRSAIKEARQINANLAQKAIDERLEPIVVAEIGKMQKVITDQIDRATKKVFHRFDTLGDTLLGDGTGEPLVDILKRLAGRLLAWEQAQR